MNPKKFFAELKRPNVYKVAIAYAVVGWLLSQIAASTFPFLQIPGWATRLVIVLVLLGFPIALVLAWAFERSATGIRRTEWSALPESPSPPGGKFVAILTGLALGAAGLLFCQRSVAQRSPFSEAL